MALVSNPLEAFSWGAGGSRMTPEQIAQQRKIADALAARGVDTSPVGHWTQGLARVVDAFAGAVNRGQADKAEQNNATASQSRIAALLGGMAGGGASQFPAAPGAAPAASSGAADYGGDQLAWTDAKPYQKALLNTISGPESGGRYDVIYGGGKFNDFSHHPDKAVRIQTGPNAGRTSSAAGKYQFLGSTWNDQAQKLGLTDFSPANQDKAAWNLAAETYKAKTGQDLDTVLQSGDPNAIASVGKVLSPIWTSLPGGIEQGTNTNRFVATYQKALGAGATPAQAQQAAAQEQAPVQVASLDPSAGVSAATARPMPPEYAAQGMTEAQWAAMNRPGEDLASTVDSPIPGVPPVNAPQVGVTPGAPAAVTPAGQRVVQAMTNPQSMTGGAPMPMQPAGGAPQGAGSPGEIRKGPDGQTYQYAQTTGMAGASGDQGWIRTNQSAGLPPAQQQPVSAPQQQVAQAMAAQNIPVMAGGSSDAIQPGQGGGGMNAAIAQALSDPYASAQEKQIAGIMLKQQMDQQDAQRELQIRNQDPLRQLQIKAAQKALDIPPKQWQKLDDNTLFDPASGETKQIGAGGPTEFKGTALDAQAWNILQTADPNSREYATAYSIVSQPKTQLVQTENGMMPVEVPPQLPAWLKAPGAAGGAAVAPSAPAPVSSAAPQAGAVGGVVPGTKKPPTEMQARNGAIGKILLNEVPTLGTTFKALADPKGQFLSLFGAAGNPWQSEEYQRAAGSVKTSVSNVLYSLSGASSNPGEVLNQIDVLTPKYGDKPGTITDKLNRFKAYVRSVSSEANDPALTKMVEDALSQMDPPAADKKPTVIDGYTIEEVH